MTLDSLPQRIARSVIGHLLAATAYTPETLKSDAPPMIAAMRRYVLNPNESLPDSLSVFIWPFPASTRVIMPPFFRTTLGGSDHIVGGLIKFYPLAFYVIHDLPSTATATLPQLVVPRELTIDAVTQISLPLRRMPGIHWPETPGTSEILLLNGAESSFASPSGDLQVTI